MQIKLLVAQALSRDQAYQQLRERLLTKEQSCLKQASTKEQTLRCSALREHFDVYLSEYSYQHQEKGRKICSEVMKRQSDLGEKMRVKNECVAFYQKSTDIFRENVRDKLTSLVYNLDFSQL